MPKLMGAPAYARPPRPVDETPRPLTRDDLPIEAQWTQEVHDLAAAISVGPSSRTTSTAARADSAADDETAGSGDRGRSRSIVARLGLRRG
jgi:hypothetical protein